MQWPSTRSPTVGNLFRATAFVASACALTVGAFAGESQEWQVVGRQGIVNLVLVPAEQATDMTAYEREIDRLCKPGQTCFLNFYTNSRNLAITVPLPDGIANEATATFRRSTKQGAQMFMWSCRMKASTNECF